MYVQIIFLCICSEQKGHQSFYWWQYITKCIGGPSVSILNVSKSHFADIIQVWSLTRSVRQFLPHKYCTQLVIVGFYQGILKDFEHELLLLVSFICAIFLFELSALFSIFCVEFMAQIHTQYIYQDSIIIISIILFL